MSFQATQDGAWSADDIRANAQSWSLEGDAKLLELMKNLSKVREIEFNRFFVLRNIRIDSFDFIRNFRARRKLKNVAIERHTVYIGCNWIWTERKWHSAIQRID